MTTFHRSLDYTIYQCKICFEAWPQKTKIRSNKKTLSNYVCTNCLRDKQVPKKFSVENYMKPSSVPKELQGLTNRGNVNSQSSPNNESFYKTWRTKRLFWALYQVASRC